MTIRELHDLFDLIQDKNNSPYFNQEEKDEFFHFATEQVVKDYLRNKVPSIGENINQVGDQPLTSVESDSISATILSHLSIPDLIGTLDANNKLTYTSLNTLIQTVTGNTTDEYWYVLNASLTDDTPVRLSRYNDINKFSKNYFKKPSITNPLYYLSHDSIVVLPNDIDEITLSVLRKPRSTNYLNDITVDLPSIAHLEVLKLALSLASIPINDQFLTQFKDS